MRRSKNGASLRVQPFRIQPFRVQPFRIQPFRIQQFRVQPHYTSLELEVLKVMSPWKVVILIL